MNANAMETQKAIFSAEIKSLVPKRFSNQPWRNNPKGVIKRDKKATQNSLNRSDPKNI
jgi:hypothetical protein